MGKLERGHTRATLADMSERIQQLLREVQSSAAASTPNKRLVSRFPHARQRDLDKLRSEIAEEIAHSLGRVARKLEGQLHALELLLARRDSEHFTHSEMAQLQEAFDVERKRAEQSRYFLQVQREALGMHRPEELERRYPIPHWR